MEHRTFLTFDDTEGAKEFVPNAAKPEIVIGTPLGENIGGETVLELPDGKQRIFALWRTVFELIQTPEGIQITPYQTF